MLTVIDTFVPTSSKIIQMQRIQLFAHRNKGSLPISEEDEYVILGQGHWDGLSALCDFGLARRVEFEYLRLLRKSEPGTIINCARRLRRHN